ncbi:hypothetical protein GCM10023170_093160 [Phytohabitans houttuyneae]|uniref:Uncharacterized protein n=1 Tax=Phytohabitans houttuyneae TaxID=1076126 RepID=A0A6V8KIH9_9ACTN|nr:hypothetical protein Phou_091930 [Phytohabitans houttuyneae]
MRSTNDRGLKHRAETETRAVPIPPEPVVILHEHIERVGVADDGRRYRSDHGNVAAASTYSRVWDDAWALGLPPDRVESPLAGRPILATRAGSDRVRWPHRDVDVWPRFC